MNILAVGAHPDDMEILAAGTLAAYAKQGHTVTICVMTNGELGSETLPKQEISELRRAEAERSATVLGAELLWLDEPDGFLYDTPATRAKMISAIRTARPDVIITHSPEDYHPDHRTASKIAVDARQLGCCALLSPEEPPAGTIPVVLLADTLGGIGCEPEFWVDISATIGIKLAMLREHRSQNDWLRSLHGTDYTEFVERLGSLRGLQAGTGYAEGFRLYRGYPVPADVTELLPGK
ncbi:PIG-L family deacetylase [Haloechinothrix sp. LS1_15]|uniref:PIG-L deacetylase family protein n=1 Tax=Haloechinothrix sp. LS1_15 TaxID=2652248 RepID=UPI0029468265|nr:PIG-L family deacetylase [Haloechinothrix sp. LS1_15]MDV6012434.1 PIG-L family deacetylase [Haloechinothrix sp. LS1_15]